LLWWYWPRAGLKIAAPEQAKSVPAFAVAAVVEKEALSEGPYVPSPTRRSADIVGQGLPPGTGHGSTWLVVTMAATRVSTRMVRMELPQVFTQSSPHSAPLTSM